MSAYGWMSASSPSLRSSPHSRMSGHHRLSVASTNSGVSVSTLPEWIVASSSLSSTARRDSTPCECGASVDTSASYSNPPQRVNGGASTSVANHLWRQPQ